MNFIMVFASNGDAVETIKSWVPDDNFGLASMMAAAGLFARTDANNVTCYRVFGGHLEGTIAEDNFFYAEKG